MKHLYHATTAENAKSILTNGLHRKGICIYCSENPNSWLGIGDTVLKVDISEINAKMTTFGEPDLDEVMIWVDKIEAIYSDTGVTE